MQPFSERHGLNGAMVAPTKIIAGLGLSLGLELLECVGATGDYRTDFAAKARMKWLCYTLLHFDDAMCENEAFDRGFHVTL